MAPRVAKQPKQVQPFTVPDLKKCGTIAQQTELFTFLQSLNQAQLQAVQSLIQRMSTGACINGDNTIDPTTGMKTTGGYRKSVHYMKAYFANRPMPVNLD